MAKHGLSRVPRLSGPESQWASSLKWLFVHRLGSWTHLPSLASTCYVVLSRLGNQANIKYPLIQTKLAPRLSNEAIALDHVMCLEVEDQILHDWPLIWKFPEEKTRINGWWCISPPKQRSLASQISRFSLAIKGGRTCQWQKCLVGYRDKV